MYSISRSLSLSLARSLSFVSTLVRIHACNNGYEGTVQPRRIQQKTKREREREKRRQHRTGMPITWKPWLSAAGSAYIETNKHRRHPSSPPTPPVFISRSTAKEKKIKKMDAELNLAFFSLASRERNLASRRVFVDETRTIVPIICRLRYADVD